MSIELFMKNTLHARLSYQDKWLVWDGEWEVYQHTYGSRKTRNLYSGADIKAAIDALAEKR